MSRIAKTIFDSGPQDDLIAVDTYKGEAFVSTGDYQRKQQGLSKYEDPNFTQNRERVRTNTVTSEQIGQVVKDVSHQSHQKSLGERVKGVLGDNKRKGVVTPSRVENDFLASLGEESGLYDKKTKVLIGNVETTMRRGDISNAKDLSRFLSSMTGDEALGELLDSEAEVAFLDSVIKSAIDLGIPDAIDAILESSRHKKAAEKAMANNLGRLARTSDVRGVRKVVERIGRMEALRREPRLIQYLLSFYRLPGDSSKTSYPSQLSLLTETLDLIDPQWHSYNRAGVTISNLSPFSYASEDALTLFRTDSRYRTEAMIGGTHRSGQLINLAKQNYPLAAV